jgi:hypothetical protein
LYNLALKATFPAGYVNVTLYFVGFTVERLERINGIVCGVIAML